MKRHQGYAHFPTAFLTFSALLLVLAVGFVVGRVVVAGAYRDAAPEFEKLPAAEAPEQVEPEPRESLAPGSVHVPPPAEAPAETLPGEAPEEASPEAGEVEAPPAEAPLPPTTARPMPAPPAPQPPREPAPLVPEAPPASARGYTIQVGLFTSQEGARQVADDLARAGHPARIVVERGEAATLYRVLTGQYRTEYAARSAVEQLRQEGFPAFLLPQ